MTNKRRRRGKKRARIAAKIMRWTLIGTVLLAFAGLGVWLIWDRAPGTTVTTVIVEHEELIRQYAVANGIEPAYAASVIMAESSYREDAVSSVNAQGLMQILPSTGEWIAGKYAEEYTEGSLFDAETNIRYGCWYLGFLMNRYGGDMRTASSAYHQGQGRVDGWLDSAEYSADGVKLDRIPSDATTTYVNRVLKYYERYEEIYGKSESAGFGAGSAADSGILG